MLRHYSGATRDEDTAMGRFASVAELYEKFRQPYPPEFFRAIADELKLSKQHALIDLGTGPGLLAIGFAPYAGRVTAVDPEPAMLAAAREAGLRAGQKIDWISGRAEDLPDGIGQFDVVSIGRALHWMDREALGPLFAQLVKPGGAIVICGSSSVRDGRNEWLDTYNEARRLWSNERLWSEAGKGDRTHRELITVLERLGFHVAETIRVETTHEVSVSDLAQRVLTFSSSSPAALGDKVDAMLADVEARLSPFNQSGSIAEVLVSAADIIKRD
jgi:ubiquinone/menaquinone biosynthesis C-methylase UbiE